MFGLASYWMGIGSFGVCFFFFLERTEKSKWDETFYVYRNNVCFLVFFTLIFNYIYVSVHHAHCISRTGCFFCSGLFFIGIRSGCCPDVNCIRAWGFEEICIINKHVESVGEMEEHGTLRIGERNPGRLPLLWRHFLLFIFIIRSTSAFHLHCIRHRDCSFGMFL